MKDSFELKTEIYKVFNKEDVKQEGDNLSLYDTIELLKKEFIPYTNFLVLDLEKTVKKINRKIRFGYRIPTVSKIVPTIKDDKAYLYIYFVEGRKDAGVVELSASFRPVFSGIDYNEYPLGNICKMLNENRETFTDYLSILRMFNENHPGFDYEFDKESDKYNYVYDDGFMSCKINPNDLYRNHATFSNLDDIILATSRSRNLGVIYDYVEMYNDEIKHKCEVNINDLNPILKYSVEKQLNNDSPVLRK